MIDLTTKLGIKALEGEVKRLVEAEEYDEALQALDTLLAYLGLERDDEQ